MNHEGNFPALPDIDFRWVTRIMGAAEGSMSDRPRWILGGSVIGGIAMAALVVFLGLEAGSGDPIFDGPDPNVTETANPAANPDYYTMTILPPQEHEGDFPVTVALYGEERMPYDPAALLERIRSVGEPYTWIVFYDDDPNPGERSGVQFDWDGRVMVQRILPWHAVVFEPLLALAGATVQVRSDVDRPPTSSPTALPTPLTVVIRSEQVMLPVGVTLSEVQGTCTTAVDCSRRYVIRKNRSPVIVFDDYGIVDEAVDPSDAALVRLLQQLKALNWPFRPQATPIVYSVRGVEITLPIGAYVTSALANCPHPSIVPGGQRCSPRPHTIIYNDSSITYDDLGIANINVQPEDEAALNPVLERLSLVVWDPIQ
jgi:hypothetical protein